MCEFNSLLVHATAQRAWRAAVAQRIQASRTAGCQALDAYEDRQEGMRARGRKGIAVIGAETARPDGGIKKQPHKATDANQRSGSTTGSSTIVQPVLPSLFSFGFFSRLLALAVIHNLNLIGPSFSLMAHKNLIKNVKNIPNFVPQMFI